MKAEDCDNRNICRNAENRCFVCDGERQFKPKKYLNKNQLRSTPSKKKKGMGFEEDVAQKYNKYMAQRQPLSGGIMGFEGDIKTVITLMECKERDKETSRGEKTISLKKKWLEQIESESKKHDKLPVLPFRYKSSPNDIYMAMDYDYLLDLLYRVKRHKEKREELEKENKMLREKLKEEGD